MRSIISKVIFTGCLFGLSAVSYADQLSGSTSKTVAVHKKDKQSQEKIDRLDASAREAVDEYLTNERISDVTEAYNRQVAVLVDSQKLEIMDLEQQIESLEETDRAVLPMLNRMVGMLEAFVTKDTPFLIEERHARVERMKKLLSRADVSVAEKYRQILEAYSVEVQYGRTLEAYNGSLSEKNGQQVTFLRLGRVALYYQSLNGVQSAIWQPSVQSWEMLDEQQNLVLTKAIQVAQQQKVPELMSLPLPAVEK